LRLIERRRRTVECLKKSIFAVDEPHRLLMTGVNEMLTPRIAFQLLPAVENRESTCAVGLANPIVESRKKGETFMVHRLAVSWS
jgi:hypothetical protein